MKIRVTIALLIWPFCMKAQVFNNGLLTIDGAVLTANDSVVNEGTLLNNGDIVVSGGWMNGGNYSPDGSGEAIFDGSGLQVIDHERQSFTKLVIRGGGRKIFSTDLSVKNLVLEDGLLVSNNNSKISLTSNGSVTGGSDRSHVVGTVQYSGAGDWLFPVGDYTNYTPLKINGVSDATASASVTEYDLVDQTLSASPVLESISDHRYWNLSLDNGSLAGSKISLAMNGEDNLSDSPTLLTVATAPSLPGPFSDLGYYAVEGNRSSGWVTALHEPVTGYYAVASVFDEASGLVVHNAISPNGDGKNEMMIIDNINVYPDNVVTIFNRWGDKVFVMAHYNNAERSFRGTGNVNNSGLLPPATYFYSVETKPGGRKITGYLVIR